MSKRHIECPECGTEVEADECDCTDRSQIADEHCERCGGKGYTKDYHCHHCDWQREE